MEPVHPESPQFDRSYRDLLEGLDCIVVEADADTLEIAYVSPQAESILGFPLDAWYSGPEFWSSDIVHPDYRGALEAVLGSASEEVRSEVEFRALRANGSVIWIRGTFNYSASHSVIRGLLRDVTAERLTEESLRRNKDQLQLALEAAGMGVWDWNLEQSAVFWSDKVYNLHGFGVGEIELDPDGYMNVFGRIHPEDADRAQVIVRDALKTGADYEIEYRVQVGEELRWLLASGRIFMGESGAPVRVAGTVQDVTSRKNAEEALREETRTLQTISDVNAVLAGELELKKLVQAVTDAGRTLTGAEVGAFFYNVVNEDGEEFMLYSLSGAPREAFEHFPMPRNTEIFNPTFSGEATVRLDDVTKDPRYGKNAPFYGMPEGHLPVRSYLATPVISRSGEAIGGLFFGHAEPGVFTERAERLLGAIANQAAIAIENARLYQAVQNELTERKRTEEELKELTRTLEQRVKARTLEIERANRNLKAEIGERIRAEAEIEHVNKALRRSNRELQDFAYVASHDLQEPLRKISTFADLLQLDFGDQLDETAIDYVQRMQSASERMTDLIQGLLAFSRVKSQGQPFESTDLREVIRNVLSDLEVRINETDAVVELGSLPTIEADPLQMRQLFQNLISNALKFRKNDRSPLIAIDFLVEEGQRVQITVQDNGIGFDQEYAERIFSPFQRLHSNEQFEGTGMGLAICRRIVERHDGSIAARSKPGKGTKIVISLPLRQASGPPV